MGDPTHAVCALAQRILEHELRACSDDASHAFAAVFARLERVTAGLVGTEGYRALMRRALARVAQQHAWFGARSEASSTSFPADRWDEVAASHGLAAAQAVALSLLAHALDSLSEFVGAELTARVIRRAWNLPVESDGVVGPT